MVLFEDRTDGGRQLAQLLSSRHFAEPVVVGLPRGGVVTAAEVAKTLNCPLEVVVVRKIGAPFDSEYGIGAMSEDEVCFFSPESSAFDLESDEVLTTIEYERAELRRRVKSYRGKSLSISEGQTIILVDDGLATGVTSTAALKFLAKFNPQKMILAAPVGPRQTYSYLRELCDEIIILQRPMPFFSVGSWYREFEQVSDEEVRSILNNHKKSDAS